MPRSLLVAVSVALAGFVATAQQPVPPFRAGSDLIVVPAVVVDKKGAVVPGLTQDNFRVLEDGKPVAIETFVAANAGGGGPEEPRFIVLVLDNLRTPTELGYRVRNIAKKFVDRMRPSDMISVISLNRGQASSTSSQAEVRAAIDRFRPSFGDTIRDPAEDAAQGLQAISDLSQQIAKAPHRRKTIVFIGAAGIFSPKEASAFGDRGPNLSPIWFDAIRETARNNVSIYAIDPAGQNGDYGDYSQSFATETGGSAWANTNNFEAAVERIWRETGSYYLLGYTPPINDHRLHKIEVQVTVPGVTVRARRGRG